MNDYVELIAKCDEWVAKADNLGADDLANHIARCGDAIEQLIKERDAAVEDLKEGSFCMNCKHLVSTKEEKPCRHCSSLTGGGEDNWEWRGVGG